MSTDEDLWYAHRREPGSMANVKAEISVIIARRIEGDGEIRGPALVVTEDPCPDCDGTGWAAERTGTSYGGLHEQIGVPCPRGCPSEDDA